ADIQGMSNGIEMPAVANGATIVKNSYLRNITNILIDTMGSVNGNSGLPAREEIIDNVQFAAPAGQPYQAIVMNYQDLTADGVASNVIESDQCFVTNYNGIAGDDFQVYYYQQVASYIVPQTGGGEIGSPVAGLTNQQNMEEYGICIAGSIAPANA